MRENRIAHTLKIWPEYYQAVREGRKTFEVRKSDWDFQEGDLLNLQEFDPKKEKYTGRAVVARITYILTGSHAPEGLCIMSIKVV